MNKETTNTFRFLSFLFLVLAFLSTQFRIIQELEKLQHDRLRMHKEYIDVIKENHELRNKNTS